MKSYCLWSGSKFKSFSCFILKTVCNRLLHKTRAKLVVKKKVKEWNRSKLMHTMKQPCSLPWSRCTTPALPISGKNQIGWQRINRSKSPIIAGIDSQLAPELSSFWSSSRQHSFVVLFKVFIFSSVELKLTVSWVWLVWKTSQRIIYCWE